MIMANWQSIDELQDIASDLPRFTHALDELSRRLGLDITPLTADHISLRCHQNVTAERWRRGFEQCGELMSENMINGRPICLFKLHEPLQVAHWQFSIVELPWPGEKRYPHEGWEHIEIVLPGDPETLNARALALLSDEGLSLPGISVKTSSPKVSMNDYRIRRWRSPMVKQPLSFIRGPLKRSLPASSRRN